MSSVKNYGILLILAIDFLLIYNANILNLRLCIQPKLTNKSFIQRRFTFPTWNRLIYVASLSDLRFLHIGSFSCQNIKNTKNEISQEICSSFKVIKVPLFVDQLIVSPLFNDTSFLENVDFVTVFDGVNSVGNGNGSSVFHDQVQ